MAGTGDLIFPALVMPNWAGVTDCFTSSQILEFSSKTGVDMNPSILIKQPWERRTFSIDFTDRLLPGDYLSSVYSITALLSSVDKTTEIVYSYSLDGNKFYLSLMAGTSGNTYNIRVRLLSTNGDQLEDDLDLIVREKS